MAALNTRPKAILSISKSKKISDFIVGVRTIILCVGNNSTIFQTPPSLVHIANTLSNLERAEMLSNSGSESSIADRNLKYDIALKAVKELLDYIQSIADNAEDEITARSIIDASGFGLIDVAAKIRVSVIDGISGTGNEY